MTGSLYFMDEAADFDPRIWEKMLEDHYSGKKSITFHTVYTPLQWIDYEEWTKPFPPERFYSAEQASITEKQITDLMKEMEKNDE
jgi:hypothetical protein